MLADALLAVLFTLAGSHGCNVNVLWQRDDWIRAIIPSVRRRGGKKQKTLLFIARFTFFQPTETEDSARILNNHAKG